MAPEGQVDCTRYGHKTKLMCIQVAKAKGQKNKEIE